MRSLFVLFVAACAPGGDHATPPTTELDRLPDAAFPFGYVATYPPGTVDHVGAAFIEGQRTARFTTGAM